MNKKITFQKTGVFERSTRKARFTANLHEKDFYSDIHIVSVLVTIGKPNIQYIYDMEEVWKDIEGYSVYQVSNLGRVRSLKRGIVLKQRTSSKYAHVILCRLGKEKEVSIHRLMMEAFVPNPLNLPCVNHKDENKLNNFIFVNPDGTVDLEKSNLEWCDYMYNNTYGSRKRTEKQKKTASEKRKAYLKAWEHTEKRKAYKREYYKKKKSEKNNIFVS